MLAPSYGGVELQHFSQGSTGKYGCVRTCAPYLRAYERVSCAYAHSHVHTKVPTHVGTHAYTSIRTCVRMCVRTCVRTFVCTCECAYALAYARFFFGKGEKEGKLRAALKQVTRGPVQSSWRVWSLSNSNTNFTQMLKLKAGNTKLSKPGLMFMLAGCWVLVFNNECAINSNFFEKNNNLENYQWVVRCSTSKCSTKFFGIHFCCLTDCLFHLKKFRLTWKTVYIGIIYFQY